MTSSASSDGHLSPDQDQKSISGDEDRPEWAQGLRRLYDSVVEEPLPDSFKDLLSKLDSQD